MTLPWIDETPRLRPNRNVIPFPVQSGPTEIPATRHAFVEIDVDAGRALLAPRSRFGPLFGLTQRDIDRAAELARFGETVARPTQESLVGSRWTRTAKRIFDVSVSAACLLVLLPLLLFIALLVRLDSPGPALYRQTRVGWRGRTFSMYKFRSMVVDADQKLNDLLGSMIDESTHGVLFKVRNDPRVTRVGRFLRKHSLDELPQLWNVLVGTMSLVGPRPPLPTAEGDDSLARRLAIRPGITGLWQITAGSSLTESEKNQLDLYYVENWSLLGDLLVLWRTIKVLFIYPVATY